MNTYNTIILNLIKRMVNDRYSESRISKIKRQMNKLSQYLSDNNLNEINEDIVVKFVKDIYLKKLLEFKDTGNYLKHHSKILISNGRFYDVYKEYEKYLNTRNIEPITKKCKLIKTRLFLNTSKSYKCFTHNKISSFSFWSR